MLGGVYFQIVFTDLAFIKFTVIDTNSSHIAAQRIIPLRCLKPGNYSYLYSQRSFKSLNTFCWRIFLSVPCFRLAGYFYYDLLYVLHLFSDLDLLAHKMC